VGLDGLDLRAVAVDDLQGEGIAVTDERTDENALALVEGLAGDVDALGLTGEVLLVKAGGLRVVGMRLRLDAVADDVDAEVVENLTEQRGLTLGPAALLDHLVAIPGRQVSAHVIRLRSVDDAASVGLDGAAPLVAAVLVVERSTRRRGRLGCRQTILPRGRLGGLRDFLAGGHNYS